MIWLSVHPSATCAKVKFSNRIGRNRGESGVPCRGRVESDVM